jgi:hypothetical protein
VRLTRRPAGLPTDSSLRSASVFDGAPEIKIKSQIKSQIKSKSKSKSGSAKKKGKAPQR